MPFARGRANPANNLGTGFRGVAQAGSHALPMIFNIISVIRHPIGWVVFGSCIASNMQLSSHSAKQEPLGCL